MKKIILLFALSTVLFSCKKENTSPNNDLNSSELSISSLDCDGVKINGELKVNTEAINVSALVMYTGGNGKSFSTIKISSEGVTGLTATLNAGTLVNGNGELKYEISGKASNSGEAVFKIILGGKSCSFKIEVDSLTPTSGYGASITDIDNNTYKTVYIGDQLWMAENLKTTKFNDGTDIDQVTDKSLWINKTSPAWTYYNNSDVNNQTYGKLYNWYVANSTSKGDKNVCPSGWRVPTDLDWDELINYLDSTADGGLNYPNVAGSKLKQVGITNWASPNSDATNSTLFSALPGGLRGGNGEFYSIGNVAYFWSKTEKDTDNAWYRALNNLNSNTNKNHTVKTNGLSIRCIKD